MPFKSEAQRGYMFANMPEMAKRWAAHTPKGKKLPKHVHHKKGGLLSSLSEKDAGVFHDVLTNFGRMTANTAKHVGMPGLKNWTQGAGEDVKGNATGLVAAIRKLFPGVPADPGKIDVSDLKNNLNKAIEAREHALGSAAAGVGAIGVGAPVLYNAFTNTDLPQETSLNTGKGDTSDEGTKVSECIGTPFTDGFLQCCLDKKLSGEQVATLLEKGAELKDRTGEECRGLIERMTA